VTTWDEAQAMLEGDETVEILQVQDASNSSSKQIVLGEVDGDPCCQWFTDADGIVIYIRLGLLRMSF
jgi:hypothetical protein